MISNITTDIEPIYRQWYAKSYENMYYREAPLLGMLAKEASGGEQVKQPIKIGPGAGQSAKFATALANVSPAKRRAFLGDWGIDYSLAKVDNTTIELSQNDRGAIVKALADETETVVDAQRDRLEKDLFSSGYGEIGTVSAISTVTLTLTLRSDTQNFYPGKVVQAAATITGAMRNAGATAVVSAVDRDAGTLTSATNWTTQIAALAVGDVIFGADDRGTGATPGTTKVVGLSGWLPLAAPTAGDSFFNVDRSIDAVALAGVRVDGRGKPPSQALYDLAVRIGENGGKPDIAFTSFDDFGNLAIEMGNRDIYENIQGQGITVYYSAITIAGPKGPIKVFPDTFCPGDRSFVLTKRDWTIYCGNGPNPMYPSLKNGALLDDNSSDAVQVRHKTLAQLMCAAPGHSGVTQRS